MSGNAYDIAIIGGGIVGMATAMALLQRRRRRLVVLEAETSLAQHQTGRNSGVIHSGLYYKPGSLKATLCAAGREAMFRFCEERGIAHERCGKIVVATADEQLPALAELERRGHANGLLGVRRCSIEELREHEPHVAGVSGLFVPETGIVSYAAVLEEMAKVVVELGGEVRLGTRATFVRRNDRSTLAIDTEQNEVVARNLINCAGVYADRVARNAGFDPGVRIVPFRGEYYEVVESRRSLCKNLIYPVPDPRFPFLGVHYTRATNGEVEAGPNAVLALSRVGYTLTAFRDEDVLEMIGFDGFRRLIAEHWRMGLFELHRSLSKAAFVRALQALIPEIRAEDIVRGRAGVRAQAVEKSGKLVDDFRLVAGAGMLHVLNAPSPAATASIAIGDHLAGRAEEVFS
jgi:L-2-hydroxyglutarate oxidase